MSDLVRQRNAHLYRRPVDCYQARHAEVRICLVKPAKLKGLAARKFADLLMALGFVKALKAKTGMPAWRRDEGTEYGIEQE